MNKIRTFSYGLLICATAICQTSRADSFDDAVNQFLKGFEYCKEAKSHLSGGRTGDAQAALKQYERLLAEASRTNADILKTSKRGMDGNLKFCQRVTRDVEVEVGMPTMNQALAECDAAQQSLKDDSPDQAQQHHAQFKALRDKALTLAPSLSDIFTVKNQISRCDRIETKIASFSKQQQALTLSLETAQEESEAYLASCQKTLEILKAEKIDDPVLRDANQGLNSANSHKKNVKDEVLAYKTFAENPQHPTKKIIDGNLAKGDRCNTELTTAIGLKKQELDNIKKQFARYNEQLAGATTRCESARKSAAKVSSQEAYDTAKSDYEKAQKMLNDTRAALSKDNNYSAYQGREDVVQIEKQMQALNGCLADTKRQMGVAFAKLPAGTASTNAAATTIATPKASKDANSNPATSTNAGAASGTAQTMEGTITMMGLIPEFALFYAPDGTQPQAPEIVVERTGFEQQLYIAPNNAVLNFKNKDNTAHRISVSNDVSKFSENLTRLQPRQSKTAKVSWPENSIVALRSDRGTFATSYIANIPTANYLQLDFAGAERLNVRFVNDKASTIAYLIMPDTDVLTFTLSKGETKSLAITRDGVPVGSLVVTGK